MFTFHKTHKRPLFIMGSLLIIGLAVSSFFFISKPIPTQAKNATLKAVEGIPQIKAKGQGQFKDAISNQILGEGDQIRTTNNSVAMVFFANNSSIFLDHNSEIALRELPTKDNNQVRIEQSLGETWSKVIPNTGTQYEVKSETAIAAVRGTIFKMQVDKDKNSKVEVLESKVDVGIIDSGHEWKTKTLVEAGNTILIQKENIPGYVQNGLQREIQARVKPVVASEPTKQTCLDYKIDHFATPDSIDKKQLNSDQMKSCLQFKEDPGSLAKIEDSLPVLETKVEEVRTKQETGQVQTVDLNDTSSPIVQLLHSQSEEVTQSSSSSSSSGESTTVPSSSSSTSSSNGEINPSNQDSTSSSSSSSGSVDTNGITPPDTRTSQPTPQPTPNDPPTNNTQNPPATDPNSNNQTISIDTIVTNPITSTLDTLGII